MSSPNSTTSPAISWADDFDMSITDGRSRASTFSDIGGMTTSDSGGFSDLSAGASPMSAGQAMFSGGEEDFVLVQNVLSQSNSTQRTERSRQSMGTSLSHHAPVVESDEEDDDTDVASDEGTDEEGARARQRRARDVGDGDSDSEGESILFRGSVGATRSQEGLRLTAPSPAATRIVNREADVATPTRDMFLASRSSVASAPPTTVASPKPAQAPPAAPSPLNKPAPARQPISTKPNASQARRAQRKPAVARAPANQVSSGTPSASSDSNLDSYASDSSDDAEFSDVVYQEAVAYVSTYLKAPPAHPSPAIHLHFMQSLIIELGLLRNGRTLPTSCNTAKALIKNQVHLNVRDYITHRTKHAPANALPSQTPSQKRAARRKRQAARANGEKVPEPSKGEMVEVGVGVEALQKLMFPSKSALMKSLRAKKAKVPREWVKKAGLGVFLVTVFH